jgi:molecular chaperone GrpE
MKEHKHTNPETEQINMNTDTEIEKNTDELSQQSEVGELSQTTTELNELKDKYLRLVAEFENYKRRTAKEKQEIILTGNKNVVRPLLEILDDIDRAETMSDKSQDATKEIEGNKLIFQKFKNILLQNGIKEMKTKGVDFDPDKFEAISEIDAGKENTGKVVDVLEKGYSLNGHIIRHAKVIVGK